MSKLKPKKARIKPFVDTDVETFRRLAKKLKKNQTTPEVIALAMKIIRRFKKAEKEILKRRS